MICRCEDKATTSWSAAAHGSFMLEWSGVQVAAVVKQGIPFTGNSFHYKVHPTSTAVSCRPRLVCSVLVLAEHASVHSTAAVVPKPARHQPDRHTPCALLPFDA
ncbi:unnamed protein product [Ectocarpus sp. 13 AM-2016]